MAKGESTVGESEEIMDSLLEGTSRSFYLTLKVLPKKIRKQISLGYLLPRLSDTIADSKVGENKILLKLLEEYNQRIQDGKNPNEVLGFRSEVNTNIFKDFSKEIMSEGATILGGCCNVSPNYINALRSLKN